VKNGLVFTAHIDFAAIGSGKEPFRGQIEQEWEAGDDSDWASRLPRMNIRRRQLLC
jgi:hypothetical protein